MKPGWTEVALGDLMPRRGGSIDPRKYPDEEFSLLSIPAFDAGAPEHVTGSAVGSTKQVVEPGDVLLAKIVPHIRRAWIVPAEPRRCIGSSEWIVFRDPQADPRYLRHLLVSDRFHQSFMQTVAGVGGSLLRARPAHVAKITVPLPPLDEQKRIAAILDKADELQAKRRAAITHLDSLTQAIFLDMFGDRITRTQSGPREPLAGLVVRPLRNGAYFEQDRYRTGDAGVEMVHMSDAFGGVVSTGELRRVDVSAAELDRYGLTSNDLLVARRSLNFAGSAKPCRIPDLESTGPLIYESSLIRVSPDSSVLDVSYLYGLLANEEFRRREILPFVTGATISGISQSNLAKVEIPTPPLEDQIRFAQRADSIVRKSTLFCNHRDVLSDLVSSVQARAFRGEL